VRTMRGGADGFIHKVTSLGKFVWVKKMKEWVMFWALYKS